MRGEFKNALQKFGNNGAIEATYSDSIISLKM